MRKLFAISIAATGLWFGRHHLPLVRRVRMDELTLERSENKPQLAKSQNGGMSNATLEDSSSQAPKLSKVVDFKIFSQLLLGDIPKSTLTIYIDKSESAQEHARRAKLILRDQEVEFIEIDAARFLADAQAIKDTPTIISDSLKDLIQGRLVLRNTLGAVKVFDLNENQNIFQLKKFVTNVEQLEKCDLNTFEKLVKNLGEHDMLIYTYIPDTIPTDEKIKGADGRYRASPSTLKQEFLNLAIETSSPLTKHLIIKDRDLAKRLGLDIIRTLYFIKMLEKFTRYRKKILGGVSSQMMKVSDCDSLQIGTARRNSEKQ